MFFGVCAREKSSLRFRLTDQLTFFIAQVIKIEHMDGLQHNFGLYCVAARQMTGYKQKTPLQQAYFNSLLSKMKDLSCLLGQQLLDDECAEQMDLQFPATRKQTRC